MMQEDIVDRLEAKASAISEGPMQSTVKQTLYWEAAQEIKVLRDKIYDLEECKRSVKEIK